MSGRGIDFLENWIQQNVTGADRQGGRERAKELAERCVAAAAVLEVSLDDMEPDSGGVESIIYQAMLHLDRPGAPGD